jgi:hypothetical protein
LPTLALILESFTFDVPDVQEAERGRRHQRDAEGLEVVGSEGFTFTNIFFMPNVSKKLDYFYT